MALPIPRSQRKALNVGVAYGHSSKQEKSLAGKIGGSVTKASGAKREKGDVRKRGLCRIECKATENASFSVTKQMWYKIALPADAVDEIPAIGIDFLNPNGGVEESLAVLRMSDLVKLLENHGS